MAQPSSELSPPAQPDPGVPENHQELRANGLRWKAQVSEALPAWRVDANVELYEDDEDTGGGMGVMRVARATQSGLERQHDHLRVTRQAEGARRGFASLRTVLLGQPIASARQVHERLSKVKAMAVLSSDPLSSVAY